MRPMIWLVPLLVVPPPIHVHIAHRNMPHMRGRSPQKAGFETARECTPTNNVYIARHKPCGSEESTNLTSHAYLYVVAGVAPSRHSDRVAAKLVGVRARGAVLVEFFALRRLGGARAAGREGGGGWGGSKLLQKSSTLSYYPQNSSTWLVQRSKCECSRPTHSILRARPRQREAGV